MRILHLHSSFDPGGTTVRAARLMNAFGPSVEHAIVSAQADALGGATAIDRRIRVEFPADFPPLSGSPTPRRLQRIAEAMRGFDLVLTYDWGAMNAAMAHTLFGEHLKLSPLVHHEDGFNQDETFRTRWTRNWYRRIALGRATALVVPSRRLEAIARETWHQPAARVVRIANGVDTVAYGRKPRPDALPRLVKRPDELWVGTLAGLRPEQNLARLVRACKDLPEQWQLVILGEGPEREAIRAEALRLGMAHRVHLPGFVAEPWKALGLFDLIALSSDSEECPRSVVEAMAAGLAVVSPQVDDVAEMLAPENRPFLAPSGDEVALAKAIETLAFDAALRDRVGKANQARARAQFNEKAMVEAYRQVYARALRRAAFP